MVYDGGMSSELLAIETEETRFRLHLRGGPYVEIVADRIHYLEYEGREIGGKLGIHLIKDVDQVDRGIRVMDMEKDEPVLDVIWEPKDLRKCLIA